MIEQVYKYTALDDNIIEKVIFDDNLHYIHMVFKKDGGAPEHISNGNVYMTVIRGILSLKLGQQPTAEYLKGNIIKIPPNTTMSIRNVHEGILELIIIKAPAPVQG